MKEDEDDDYRHPTAVTVMWRHQKYEHEKSRTRTTIGFQFTSSYSFLSRVFFLDFLDLIVVAYLPWHVASPKIALTLFTVRTHAHE